MSGRSAPRDQTPTRQYGVPPARDPVREATLVGQMVDKYQVLGVLGQGGMGLVYEAVNTRIHKRVALKFIDAALATNDEAYKRFEREALAASAVDSPHIVQIFDAGIAPSGDPYIVMELLRGRDLGQLLGDRLRLELGEALHIIIQLLKGLVHAHAAGIVHRDLKPDNVFLVERDEEPRFVKILDFGVSKIARPEQSPVLTLTRQGMIVGTPHYMAPEQAQAFPDVDSRADLYSVGAILYECLTGRPPHMGRTYEQVIVNICSADAEDVRVHAPRVPEAVAAVLGRALARDRDVRFATARELRDVLLDAAPETLESFELSAVRRGRRSSNTPPASATPPSEAPSVRPPPPRRRAPPGRHKALESEGDFATTVRRRVWLDELPRAPKARRQRLPWAIAIASGLLVGGAVVAVAAWSSEATSVGRPGPAVTTMATSGATADPTTSVEPAAAPDPSPPATPVPSESGASTVDVPDSGQDTAVATEDADTPPSLAVPTPAPRTFDADAERAPDAALP